MSNVVYAVLVWLNMHGQPESRDLFELADYGLGAGVQVQTWRASCPMPSAQDLRALQSQADAKATQVAADAKAAAATIDNADVRLRATVIELCAELEKIKAVIRTVHPATSNAIPARSATEWGATIKAKAQGLQQ